VPRSGGPVRRERSERDRLAAVVASSRHAGSQGAKVAIGGQGGSKRTLPSSLVRSRPRMTSRSSSCRHSWPSAARRSASVRCGGSSIVTGSRENKTAHAAEQERPDVLKRREEWFEGQLDLDPERLVFIDETWASTNMARRHGRCQRAKRRRSSVPHGHWKTTTGTVRNFVCGRAVKH